MKDERMGIQTPVRREQVSQSDDGETGEASRRTPVRLQRLPPVLVQPLLDLVEALAFQRCLSREEDADHDRGESELVESNAGGGGCRSRGGEGGLGKKRGKRGGWTYWRPST